MDPIYTLTFGEALRALKNGKCVARAGWNGKGMCVYLNKGAADFDKLGLPATIEGISSHMFEHGDTGIVTRLPNINMRTASGSTVTGWLASQTDMLAEDWGLLA